MTSLETYPIHRCVYRDDETTLKELLKDENFKKRINEKDNHGNTPLNLALMLGRRNCIITLLNNGCDVITRNDYGWNPKEESIFLGDVDIIEKISLKKFKTYILTFGNITLKEWNKVLPNCYLKFKIKFKSQIPVMAKLLPTDTIEFYKKGNKFRINTTFGGFKVKNIPKATKGHFSFIIKFDEKTGDCKMYALDTKKKTYQEAYPNVPQWLASEISRRNINIKTIYKFYFDITNCIIKQKKGNLLKKTKRTFQLENGKTCKTDLFKVKGIKIVVRKRDNEIVIGDYKSDIKTEILNLAMNPTIIKSNLSNEKINSLQSSNSSIISGGDASDNELSDNDSIYSDNDNESINSNKADLENFEFDGVITDDSIFKKYIKNDSIDIESGKIITDIIMNGEDSEGNKVKNSDILYLSANYPDFVDNLLNKSVSHRKYLQLLKNLKVEDKSDLNSNVELEYKSTLGRRSRIKASDDPNVAFYRIFSGIPNEADSKETKDEERKRIKNYDWKKNKVTEEDYFDPSNTESIHMGRIMNIAETSKTKYIKAWITQNSNITLDQLEPVLDFVNMIIFDDIHYHNESDNALLGMKNKSWSPFYKSNRFPVKLDFNLYPTITMSVRGLDSTTDEEKIPDSLFEIPSDYTEDDIIYGKVF
ncbi:hypothetical protein BCR32DRAFT_264644 [Anaeromyces robustus]|uniref:Uncharacterized protein n=1 Tax=Anaeromyces robustus TaxID=1754192 RepID=A0A1Y1XMH6_9FUNG|nr:hypothetical protein BCR32DRAFT_264644 [Anaeromyces robustus]|eukprot:ORX86895.1 hypothetical protein BCR32DRAFT_264644 [Anaeromyces robustus]